MKITILGAGVIGLTTAYFLAKSGHKVVIIDRHNGPAEECSFSNAAQLSYCNAQPWANRGALKKGIMWMGRSDAPLKFRFRADMQMWKWLVRFLMNCNDESERENTKHILELCLYSREVLHKHEDEFNFDFDFQKTGKIFVFEKEKDMRSYQRQCQLQEVMGAPYQVLSFDELLGYEPNLKHMRDVLVGAIRDPLDDTGDIYKFCTGLNEKLKQMGVEMHYGTSVQQLVKDGKKIKTVRTDKGDFESDLFVLSLGAYSPLIAKQVGIGLPIYPLKGYSITVDVENEACAPVTSITYQSERTVFSRIGDRLRVSGTAEFAGYNHDLTPERIAMLKRLTKKVFPDCGNVDAAKEWACLRPSTPDHRPIIGNSKYDNLILNTGQGALGWTMCFASAKMTSDIINGKETEIALAPHELERFKLF